MISPCRGLRAKIFIADFRSKAGTFGRGMRLFFASVLLWGYFSSVVASNEDDITSSMAANILPESSDSSTTDNLNGTLHKGPKLKVKNVLKKVKETFRQVGGFGKLNYRHRYKSNESSTSRDDTATVLWIVFGSIGGGILLMGTYYLIRLHAKK